MSKFEFLDIGYLGNATGTGKQLPAGWGSMVKEQDFTNEVLLEQAHQLKRIADSLQQLVELKCGGQ